jgi:hypothetical protein
MHQGFSYAPSALENIQCAETSGALAYVPASSATTGANGSTSSRPTMT